MKQTHYSTGARCCPQTKPREPWDEPNVADSEGSSISTNPSHRWGFSNTVKGTGRAPAFQIHPEIPETRALLFSPSLVSLH